MAEKPKNRGGCGFSALWSINATVLPFILMFFYGVLIGAWVNGEPTTGFTVIVIGVVFPSVLIFFSSAIEQSLIRRNIGVDMPQWALWRVIGYIVGMMGLQLVPIQTNSAIFHPITLVIFALYVLPALLQAIYLRQFSKRSWVWILANLPLWGVSVILVGSTLSLLQSMQESGSGAGISGIILIYVIPVVLVVLIGIFFTHGLITAAFLRSFLRDYQPPAKTKIKNDVIDSVTAVNPKTTDNETIAQPKAGFSILWMLTVWGLLLLGYFGIGLAASQDTSVMSNQTALIFSFVLGVLPTPIFTLGQQVLMKRSYNVAITNWWWTSTLAYALVVVIIAVINTTVSPFLYEALIEIGIYLAIPALVQTFILSKYVEQSWRWLRQSLLLYVIAGVVVFVSPNLLELFALVGFVLQGIMLNRAIQNLLGNHQRLAQS